MLRRSISVILVIILVFLCVSCNNETNNDNATIQIWSYDFEYSGFYSESLSSILANAKFFCEKNDIPLEIVRYHANTISHDDYILKRNAAAANGNMIIIEDARYIHDIAKQHGDYSKLESYNSLLYIYKDKYCIPLGVGYRAVSINNNIMNYYNINIEKSIITYDEYLDVKQQMKENGARFRLNRGEVEQGLDYFLNKAGLKFVNYESEFLKDNNKFKKLLKSAIINICDDFLLYNDGLEEIGNIAYNSRKFSKYDYIIYDENSGLTFYEDTDNTYLLTQYTQMAGLGESILAVNPNSTFLSPCFYMYKKISNGKIYDLANYIVSETTYLNVTGRYHVYSPVFNSKGTKKILQVDDNWEYIGPYKNEAERGHGQSKKICNTINDVFKILVTNKEDSKLMSSYYFTNEEYSNVISSFVLNIINELYKENFNYKNEEINKMIDTRIGEFVTNFNIHYK